MSSSALWCQSRNNPSVPRDKALDSRQRRNCPAEARILPAILPGHDPNLLFFSLHPGGPVRLPAHVLARHKHTAGPGPGTCLLCLPDCLARGLESSRVCPETRPAALAGSIIAAGPHGGRGPPASGCSASRVPFGRPQIAWCGRYSFRPGSRIHAARGQLRAHDLPGFPPGPPFLTFPDPGAQKKRRPPLYSFFGSLGFYHPLAALCPALLLNLSVSC